TNAAKLMDRGETAQHRIVADLNVTSECSVVGEDDFVSDSAIVADVTIRQEISATAYSCLPIARRAPVHRDEFAKRIFIANLQIGRFARVFQVLSLLADRAVGVKFILSATVHRSLQRDMMLQPAIRPEDNIGGDHAIRSDNRSRTNLRARIDNRRWMNLHVAHLSRNVNINSPSETIASFTTQ